MTSTTLFILVFATPPTWTIIWMLEIWKLIGLRECFPFYFYCLIFRFLETLKIQGVLLGTLLCSRECVGFSGGCASMRNAPILGNSGTFPISIVFVRVSGCKPLLSLFR